jgi:hypothetical protein
MKEKIIPRLLKRIKNALRNDPSDDETRYNYALAKKMLKENPPKDDKNKDDKDKRTKTKGRTRKTKTRKTEIKIRIRKTTRR